MLFGTESVPEIVHGAAGPFPFLVFASIKDTEHIFGIVGHHAKDCHNPHPENCAGTAGNDGGGNTYNITGSDGCRQRRTETLELGDGFVLFFRALGDVLVGKDGSDGLFQPMPEMEELKSFVDDGHDNAGDKEKRNSEYAPDYAADGIVNA